MKKRTFIMGLAALALAFGSAGVIGGVSLNADSGAIMTRAAETKAATFDLTSSVPAGLTATGASLSKDGSSSRGMGCSKGDFVLTTTKEFSDITKIVIVASSNGTGGSLSATVGGTAFGDKVTVSKSNNTTYTIQGSDVATGIVSISIGKSNKSLWVKTIEIYSSVETKITSLSISPSDDLTLVVGKSQTFTLNITGTGLTGNEEATLSLGDGAEGLTLSANKIKSGESFVVTATGADGIAELSATYGDITSNKVTIMTEAAKSPESLSFGGDLTKSTYFAGETFDPTGLTATVTFTDKTTKDVTDDLVWLLGEIAADTTSATASYTENGVTVTASVDVHVRTLSSITVDANPNLTYEEGDLLDLTGMVVNKHYDDGYTEVCTDYTTSPVAGAELKQSYKSLVVSVEGVESVTLPLAVNEYIGKQYEIVTADSGDLSGTYLIVYKESSSATTGMTFNCEDISEGYNTVSLNGTKITDSKKAVDADTVTLAKFGEGYSIRMNGGANAGSYITAMSGSTKNGIAFTDDATGISISFDKNGCALIESNSKIFSFNDTFGQDRFRFYASAQKSVYLYKQLDTAAINEATTWAQSFLDGTAASCADYNADNYDKLNSDSVWAALKASYESLSENAQNIVKAQTADGNSADVLEQAVARYDHIVNRYASLTDFLGRRTSSSTVKSAFLGNNSNDSVNLAIVITCATLAAALSATFILRKKKQDR